MKKGKHTSFMIDFIKDFIDGEIDSYFSNWIMMPM